MSNYKLIYFNVTGLGESIRMLLSYGGVDFEDKRIEVANWSDYKSKMPMEQVPVLEIDGEIFHQTRALSRYLAKKFKLYGIDDLEDIEIDANVDDFEDWRAFVLRFSRDEDPAIVAKFKAEAHEKTKFFLSKFEERINRNNGYFVNNKLTWADIYFAGISEIICNVMQKDFLEDFSGLKKLNENVRSIPKIKAYLDNRPKTDF